VPPSKPPLGVQELAAGRRERRIATHGQVWHLKDEGWTAEAISRHLGISRASVFRNLHHEAFPERERRADAGRSLLDPWQDAVLGHWNSGRRDGRGLFRTLQQQGYRQYGSVSIIQCPAVSRKPLEEGHRQFQKGLN